jgi:hypothetical protein
MRFILLGLTALLGCGGDSSGPSANVAGVWFVSLSNLNNSGTSCSSTIPTRLTINGSGSSFEGGYSGGEFTCVGPDGQVSVPIGSGPILNGSINGSSVSMDLDTPQFHLSGNVSGSSMSGTVRLETDFGQPTGVVVLNGNWAAERQLST